MSDFLKDSCYKSCNGYNACIAFYLENHRRQAFSASQLIGYLLDPNPDAEDDKNAPPQKLSLTFSTADVVILGWRLDGLADRLDENKLAAVCILPKRYAELDRNAALVSAITITPVDKDDK